MRSAAYLEVLLLTLLSVRLCGAQECDFHNVVRCSVGFPAKHLTDAAPNYNAIVFHNMKITCDGKINQWKFFVHSVGPIFLDVWRPVVGERGHIQLVGTNTYVVTKKTVEKPVTFDVPSQEQIMVKAGDEIGIHYRRHDIKRSAPLHYNLTQQCNASMYEIGVRKNIKTKETLRMYHDEPVYVDRYHNLPNGCPPLSASVINVNPDIRLAGGPTNYRGRLEIKQDGKWCTVCDKWFKKYGMPMSVCRELGFDNTTSVVTHTSDKDVADTFRASADQCIAKMNPRGKLSQCTSLTKFPTSPEGSHCSHEEDMYIQCVARQRLMDPHNNRSTGVRDKGVPLTYQFGEWKMICDQRPPTWHEQNRKRSWVEAFCKELNYKRGFAFIRRFETDKYKTGYENPQCLKDNPEHMWDCPSHFYENDRCTDKTYFIMCKLPRTSDGPEAG